MISQDFALLNPQKLCSLHSKPLELYCQDCKTPMCNQCILTEHKEGKHKIISISDAFQIFKETLATLEEAALLFENKLQNGLKAVIENDTKLEKYKIASLQDIDNQVQEIIKTIMTKGDEMKGKVETIYKEKKQVNNEQINELNKIITEVHTKLSLIKQLLNCDEATTMQASETIITALEVRVSEMPKTEPNDNGNILFFANQIYDSLQQCHIGNVTQSMTDGLTLKGVESVTQGQVIVAKIIKADRCNIDANQLKATWTHPTGETNITQIDEDDNGNYIVTGKCKIIGVCRLDVSVDGEPIKQSPILIKVEQEGLVNTIELCKDMKYNYKGIVKYEDDCFLVSSHKNEMYKYSKQSEYIGKVTLPKDVKIYRMYKMENGNIAVSDDGNKCITIVNMNGEVIKSIGQGILGDPAGIHMDEPSNVVYVADYTNECVFMFDIDSGKVIRKIISPDNTIRVIDVSLTNQGHILTLEHDPEQPWNNRLQQFDNEGKFMKVLVKGDEHDMMCFQEVVVDDDENIILESDITLQIFSSDGNFIKRIDKPEDGLNDLNGLCLISQHPHSVAVVNNGNDTIKIYNY